MTQDSSPLVDVCIVGCGRWMQGDDQAGLLTVQALEEIGFSNARLVISESPAIDILSNLEGLSLLIVVDAAKPDCLHRSGTWKRLYYPVPIRPRSAAHSHGLSVDIALKVAGEIGHLPPEVWIYAISAGDPHFGDTLSSEVQGAVQSLIRTIPADIQAWRHTRELTHA